MVDQQKYGKVVKDMENNVLKKKDPFQKNMSNKCKLLNGWRKNYGGHSVRTEANDGVAFATISEDKEEQKKSGKKKEITCFRCKKVGHYASECNEELPTKTPKNGFNMLITDEDSSHDGSQDLDDYKGQYKEAEYDEEAEYDDEDDKPSGTSQEITQEAGNAETGCDDETTDGDTKKDEEYEGQFNDEDFEA